MITLEEIQEYYKAISKPTWKSYQPRKEFMGDDEIDSTIENKNDYAAELFRLSRTDCDGTLTTEVERLWCGDVATYIVGLENKIGMMYHQRVKSSNPTDYDDNPLPYRT